EREFRDFLGCGALDRGFAACGATRPVRERLSAQDVGRYVTMAAATVPSAEVVRAVHAETDGNPSFLGEVVRLLLADGQPRARGPLGAAAAGPAGRPGRDCASPRCATGRFQPDSRDRFGRRAGVRVQRPGTGE